MQFQIDIIYADRKLRVLKCAAAVKPFKLVTAPLRAYYALELRAGAIESSGMHRGDYLVLVEEP